MKKCGKKTPWKYSETTLCINHLENQTPPFFLPSHLSTPYKSEIPRTPRYIESSVPLCLQTFDCQNKSNKNLSNECLPTGCWANPTTFKGKELKNHSYRSSSERALNKSFFFFLTGILRREKHTSLAPTNPQGHSAAVGKQGGPPRDG